MPSFNMHYIYTVTQNHHLHKDIPPPDSSVSNYFPRALHSQYPTDLYQIHVVERQGNKLHSLNISGKSKENCTRTKHT